MIQSSINAISSSSRTVWPSSCTNASEMFDPITSRMEQYLDLLSARQSLVASNVANLDTPGYRTRDIDFQFELESQMAGGSPTVYEPAGLTVKNDGNRNMPRRNWACALAFAAAGLTLHIGDPVAGHFGQWVEKLGAVFLFRIEERVTRVASVAIHMAPGDLGPFPPPERDPLSRSIPSQRFTARQMPAIRYFESRKTFLFLGFMETRTFRP